MYAIIAGWDANNFVSRYNLVETEAEAQALVDRLVNGSPIPGKFDAPLPLEKRAPGAFHAELAVPAGCKLFRHQARFWKCDPAAKTVAVDINAARAWRRKLMDGQIDSEASRRIDRIFSPDNPARAERVKMELIARGHVLQDKGRSRWTAEEKSEWGAGRAKWDRMEALRAAAETFKASYAAKTPEEILAVGPNEDTHWPE